MTTLALATLHISEFSNCADVYFASKNSVKKIDTAVTKCRRDEALFKLLTIAHFTEGGYFAAAWYSWRVCGVFAINGDGLQCITAFLGCLTESVCLEVGVDCGSQESIIQWILMHELRPMKGRKSLEVSEDCKMNSMFEREYTLS